MKNVIIILYFLNGSIIAFKNFGIGYVPRQQSQMKKLDQNQSQIKNISQERKLLEEADKNPFESKPVDQNNINFNSYLPNLVELRSEGYFLSHANHQLAAFNRYQGLGELWYIQKYQEQKIKLEYKLELENILDFQHMMMLKKSISQMYISR